MGMKKRYWKTWILAAVLSLGNICLCFGADGTWIDLGDGGWSYQRANGSMARGSWEDIDGEWYYFGPDERSEERRVGKECRSAYVTGVLTCALPISD